MRTEIVHVSKLKAGDKILWWNGKGSSQPRLVSHVAKRHYTDSLFPSYTVVLRNGDSNVMVRAFRVVK